MAALLLHLRGLTFFLKGDPADFRPLKLRSRVGEGSGRPRIRCPLCAWEPERGDCWACSCNFVWNTFDTGGVCPACARRWLDTMCLRCHGWSKHEDWYADQDDDAHGKSQLE